MIDSVRFYKEKLSAINIVERILFQACFQSRSNNIYFYSYYSFILIIDFYYRSLYIQLYNFELYTNVIIIQFFHKFLGHNGGMHINIRV